MRSTLCYDRNVPFAQQSVKAWGILQSMEEEPSYVESDISDPGAKQYFNGVKSALDITYSLVDNFVAEGMIDEFNSKVLKEMLAGSLCETLFDILDSEVECGDE